MSNIYKLDEKYMYNPSNYSFIDIFTKKMNLIFIFCTLKSNNNLFYFFISTSIF